MQGEAVADDDRLAGLPVGRGDGRDRRGGQDGDEGQQGARHRRRGSMWHEHPPQSSISISNCCT
jgi:hypothetical protein